MTEENPGLQARALAWSRYWRSGVRHSCPGSFAEHYGRATQAFWRECFAEVSDGDRVLELGCGNGSLIRWFAQAAGRWPQAIDAVDLAELDDAWLTQLPSPLRQRVRLHPRTAATHLPLDDATVAQVWSQYALEYFADGNLWTSLNRVLAPRAMIAAVVHHAGSLPARVAEAERTDSEWLLAADGPFDRAMELLPWLAMSADASGRAQRDTDPRAAAARHRFNATFGALAARIDGAMFPDLLRDTAQRIMRILQGAPGLGATTAANALQTLRADLSDNHLRVAELVGCARDRSGIESWAVRLGQMGFTSIDIGEIEEQGHLFGWRFVASRGSRQGKQ